MEDHRTAPGMAGLHMAAGLALLRPEEQVFAAMLEGWGSQQVARNLGLRRNETRMLDVADFGRNPHGVEFGPYGICCVRYGTRCAARMSPT